MAVMNGQQEHLESSLPVRCEAGQLVSVCMGGSYRCIVTCAHLGNGTGRRTATLKAPLLLASGPVRYEAVLYSCGISPV